MDFRRYSDAQLLIFHKLAKTRLKAFFGGVHQTIALREVLIKRGLL